MKTSTVNMSLRVVAAITMAAATTISLSACDPASPASPDSPRATSSRALATPTTTPEVTLTDAWIKAANSGMTAIFGTLTNTSDHEITITAAVTDISMMVELHEVVEKDGQMVMQPKEGGFVIPAGGTHELAPGGDHIMIMDLNRALTPGDSITATLATSDGATIPVTAQVRSFDGGGETYAPSMDHASATPMP